MGRELSYMDKSKLVDGIARMCCRWEEDFSYMDM